MKVTTNQCFIGIILFLLFIYTMLYFFTELMFRIGFMLLQSLSVILTIIMLYFAAFMLKEFING